MAYSSIMQFVYDDGGRAAAGFSGKAGDCVTRAIAIIAELPYQDVYEALSAGSRSQRVTKHAKQKSSARDGVSTTRKWFRDYMTELGFTWTATMGIGTGCQVHLLAEELPAGRLIVSVSKHYTAVIDGVIHDTHNPQREVHSLTPYRGQELKPGETLIENGGHPQVTSIQRRCVYGYWSRQTV